MFRTTKNYQSDRTTMLVYGESGSGKTSLIKTLKGNPLIVNAENGLLSLSDIKEEIDVYDITVDTKGHPLKQCLRFEKLNHLLKELTKDEYKSRYDWLVFDSLTEVAQNLIYFLEKKYPDKRDALKLWGDYNRFLMELIKGLRDFKPYNILLLSLDAVEKDENNRRFVGINVNGKISGRIPALLDEVFYLKKFEDDDGKEQRTLLTSSYENILAKDRSGKLNKFEEANIEKIVAKIHN
jgi:energy-coupling factor transporter ATP-binding protein EcfA2